MRHPPETFLTATAPNTALLALDVSARRIGMAVTDPGRTMALPAGTLIRKKWADDATAIIKVIQDKRVGGLIIGLPLNADGTHGPAAQSRRTFARNLNIKLSEQQIEIPYTFVDEHLTTHAARDVLEGRGISQNAEDQIAAQMLLAGFLA